MLQDEIQEVEEFAEAFSQSAPSPAPPIPPSDSEPDIAYSELVVEEMSIVIDEDTFANYRGSQPPPPPPPDDYESSSSEDEDTQDAPPPPVPPRPSVSIKLPSSPSSPLATLESLVSPMSLSPSMSRYERVRRSSVFDSATIHRSKIRANHEGQHILLCEIHQQFFCLVELRQEMEVKLREMDHQVEQYKSTIDRWALQRRKLITECFGDAIALVDAQLDGNSTQPLPPVKAMLPQIKMSEVQQPFAAALDQLNQAESQVRFLPSLFRL